MRQIIIVVATILMMVASVTYARDSYVRALVLGDKNPTIEVVPLDDPNNPYRDDYTLFDHWVFDNFSSYVTDDNYWTTQLTMPNIEEGLKDQGVELKVMVCRSVVELDSTGERGYLVPVLDFTKEAPKLTPSTLGEVLLGSHKPSEQDTRPYFWSVGIEDQRAKAEYQAVVSKWRALTYPHIPEWMIAKGQEGDKYFFLPDGGVVVATPEVKNDFSHRMSFLSRYDAEGELLQQEMGDYMNWEEVLLYQVDIGRGSPYYMSVEHYDISGRKIGIVNNIASTGRYTTFRNAERDGFLAVVDYWQGKILTPADSDLTQLPLDPYPIFNMQDYEEVVRMFHAQNEM
jgi:hypothetical protein